MLFHQTFIAAQAQPELIFAALVLMGLPIPLRKDEERATRNEEKPPQ